MQKFDIDENKINVLKEKLKAYGFNESFNKENYELLNHIINDFNKILFSFKTIKKDKEFLEEKNKILEEQIETLKDQVNSLSDRNKFQDKLVSQVQILREDKKRLMSEINELQQEMNDKNKDKYILDLTIKKNKNSIDFLKLENQNYIDKEILYKKKISELTNENMELKEENDKYYKQNKNNSIKFDELEKEIKALNDKNIILEENLEKLKEEEDNLKELLKEKNKALKNGEENINLLKKDLGIVNDKLKELINKDEIIKKNNKDLLKDKVELEDELNKSKMKIEELKIINSKFEKENKLLEIENENASYKNNINEKKIKASNCEIKELDKTIKYLKKNIEQIKLMNSTNKSCNDKAFNNVCCTNICFHCECKNKTFNNNYITYNGKEYDIIKLIEDNKKLYICNRELKKQLNDLES